MEGEEAGGRRRLGARQVVEVGAAVARRRSGMGSPRPGAGLGGVRRAGARRSESARPGAARGPCHGGRGASAPRSRTRRCRARSRAGGRRARRCRAGACGASAGSMGTVIVSTPCISGLSRPSVPPIASPSTPAPETASADSRRRSSCTPPWTIPNTAWRAGPCSPCQSRQRPSQRWVRSVERAV